MRLRPDFQAFRLWALRTGRRAVMMAIVLSFGLSVAACGRAGPPRYPDGSEFPHTYPYEAGQQD